MNKFMVIENDDAFGVNQCLFVCLFFPRILFKVLFYFILFYSVIPRKNWGKKCLGTDPLDFFSTSVNIIKKIKMSILMNQR